MTALRLRAKLYIPSALSMVISVSDLTNQVLSQINPATLSAIAARLGVDPSQAQAAIQQAIPLVVGGLAHSASTDAGANAVHDAATSHAGMDVGSILGGLLGGGGGGGAGGAILGQIFGGRHDEAAQGLGQASGLSTQNAGQLLAILAPIVMSALGNMTQKQGMSPGGLGGMLGQELQTMNQGGNGGLLGSLFNQVGGLGGLLRMGESMLGPRGR